ncbi:MAG: 3-deoxy-D-manno-octulosonic acid transferase [Methylotenera sp.]|nr:3-deoxy-D-manno-octulosonic acid transferase [Methylotenera sp.]
MSRCVYTLLLFLLLPLTPFKLWWRSRKQPEYLQHWQERYGFYKLSIQKPVIWLHCVSVGETRAAEPLVKALLQAYPKHQILLTHTTPTGRATSEQLFGNRIMRAYLPYDLPFAINKFIAHFKPVVGVLMETELWFNLIAQCKVQNIPLLLANARLSEKSAHGYAKLGQLTREGLQSLVAVAAQTQQDALRLQQLGAQAVQVVGNIKFEVTPPADAAMQGQQLRKLLGEHRPIFLAASTREGEEAIILDAVSHVQIPHLLTIIVPRHPQRFNEVEALLAQRGLPYQKRSLLKENVNTETQFVLGDSMGELFIYYASADICLVGGSLLAFGGQNLIEPMHMAKPVLIGAHTYNFKEASELAVAQGAAWRVSNAQTLAQAIQTLADAPLQQAQMGAAGAALCKASQGATQAIMRLINQQIEPT